MTNQLWQIRVKAFAVQAGSLVGVAVIGVLLSPEFRALVEANFGTGFVTSSVVLFITGLVSHISNKIALGRAKRLGARLSDPDVILI